MCRLLKQDLQLIIYQTKKNLWRKIQEAEKDEVLRETWAKNEHKIGGRKKENKKDYGWQ